MKILITYAWQRPGAACWNLDYAIADNILDWFKDQVDQPETIRLINALPCTDDVATFCTDHVI